MKAIQDNYADPQHPSSSTATGIKRKSGNNFVTGVEPTIPAKRFKTEIQYGSNHLNQQQQHQQQINNYQLQPSIPQNNDPRYFNLQPTNSWMITPQKIQEYIKNPFQYECIIHLFFPKAIQKSYKSEKRLMCPPPAIVLNGNGWGLLAQHLNITASMGTNISLTKLEFMEKTTIHEPSSLTGTFAMFRARNLFVNTSKFCRLSADLRFGNASANGPTIKDIQSQRIKILSKPSKKTQKDTGSEAHLMFFRNGSQIALYNRVRGQNISTRYLYCEDQNKAKMGTFTASADHWSVFNIYLVNENTNENNSLAFETEDEYICYQNKVRLVDVATEASLPSMRIRKISKAPKGNVYLPLDKENEPVSFLHMIAFEYVDDIGNVHYLSTTGSDITWKTINDATLGINDGARWTITSAGRHEYRFYPINGTLQNISMLHFPYVIEINKPGKINNVEWLDLHGRGFGRNTRVWFGTLQSMETKYHSSKIISCAIPSLEDYCRHFRAFNNDENINVNVNVPLLITNADDGGIIYPTSFTFIYNEIKAGDCGRPAFVHEQDRTLMMEAAAESEKHTYISAIPAVTNIPHSASMSSNYHQQNYANHQQQNFYHQ